MLLGGPLTYRTLHFLMIKLCISKVSNTISEGRASEYMTSFGLGLVDEGGQTRENELD
jgi:hypothetical protein